MISNFVQVALELTTVLPNESEISRWFGEPVDMVILDSTMFEELNNNNQIHLKERYRNICQEFWIQTRASFAIRAVADDPWIDMYPKCLRNVFSSCRKENSHG